LIKTADKFYDIIHVNQQGREIASTALINYINKE